MEYLHVNTVEMLVYREQFEPRPGVYDTALIDTLLAEARQHQVHLVILWFGTWKNGSQHYMREWMKLDTVKYPRVIGKNGDAVYAFVGARPESLSNQREIQPRM